MPRTKPHRNPFGSILEKTVVIGGKSRTVWDVRKRYPVTDASGKTVYKDKTKRCYSKSEAQAALMAMPAAVALKQKLEFGIEESRRDRTLSELIEYFKTEFCKPAVVAQNRVVSGYRQNFKNIERYLDSYLEFFGDLPLGAITYEHLRKYSEHVATTPIGSVYGTNRKLPEVSTVNRKLAYLRRLLNVGVRLRWLSINPFREGGPLINAGAEKERSRVLTFEEEKTLLAACEMPRLLVNTKRRGKDFQMAFVNPWRKMKLVIVMAIDTGLRSKEIFSLTKSMIDLDARTINLPASLTKAWKARTIPISARLEAELTAHFARHDLKKQDLVFLGQKDCKKAFKSLTEYCGIADLTFHDLRHTATTWMDEAGVSNAAKMNIVGHSSERTHQRYHNLSENVIDAVREKIDEFHLKRSGVSNG